jgi:hypothetical protein
MPRFLLAIPHKGTRRLPGDRPAGARTEVNNCCSESAQAQQQKGDFERWKEIWQYQVASDRELPASAKLLVMAVSWYLNRRTRRAYPSVKLLDRVTGLSRSTIYAAIKIIEERGHWKYRAGRPGRANEYRPTVRPESPHPLDKRTEVTNQAFDTTESSQPDSEVQPAGLGSPESGPQPLILTPERTLEEPLASLAAPNQDDDATTFERADAGFTVDDFKRVRDCITERPLTVSGIVGYAANLGDPIDQATINRMVKAGLFVRRRGDYIDLPPPFARAHKDADLKESSHDDAVPWSD